ncbi:AMP-binding protein [Paracoccus marinaquae]|uniref:AMP-binding protein n=1 Tax=Paracoccus marinaquae TaxID=2841926 RepID=A0ABS6AJB7_9RHOB|nr:AMP-binding protein [Paracoccus marinaquae]MBU3030648.1 AMP-binding protein [Paracoccus marinaquae]
MSAPGLEIGESTMWRLLADNLPQRAEKVALIDAGRQATYAEVAAGADRVAGWLAASGVAAGDRVIVHLRKGIDEVTAMFGAWKIGAVVVNVNHQWTPMQLAYVAGDCRARAAILPSGVLKGLATEPLPESVEHLLVQGRPSALPGNASAWDDLPASDAAEARPDPGDLAMIIYTSGSTGKPKGVMLSHRNIRIGAVSVCDYLGLAEDDRLLSVLPYSFDAGLNQLTDAFLLGATVIHQPVSMPSEVVRMAAEHGATTIAGVPPLWNQVVRYLADSGTPLPALRRVTNTGGKIPPNILDLMPGVFPGVEFFLMYGLTEAFRSTYLPPARFAAKKGSIGHGIPNAQIFVIKHGEGIAGPGEQGELVHGGPLVSLGYWEQPDLTAQKIRPCPELRAVLGDAPVVYSGDLVRLDQDGDLWFVSRMDEMIKTQGFRLSPTEVEDIVSASGMVTDVVAYGVADDDAGQVVHVAACLLGEADAPALMGHCRKAMAHYMVPRHIHPWAGAMPRTASGKLDRPKIIAAAKAAQPKDTA